jgi:transcriptional regulator with XRE-family HTH domain
MTEDAGQKLKRIRERLNLRYRDVEDASQRIANRRGNDEYAIALSRLADIENKGTIPSIFRLYSLCAIYRLDLYEVLEWYGVNLAHLPADAANIEIEQTHLIGFKGDGHGDITIPLSLDPGIDLKRTTFLSRFVQRWGKLPLMLLEGLDVRNHRYAFVGTEDWSMYPVIAPGSLVVIEETRRKIADGVWPNEHDRPIHFLEHREGYCLGWCSLKEGRLTVQFHPSSGLPPRLFAYPAEVDVLGQVTGVAMRLDQGKRRRTRS